MASIKKRGNSYTITVSSGYDSNGKQVLHYKTYVPKGKTLAAIRRELETVAMEFEDEVKAGKYLDGDHLNFEQLIERWQENYASTNLSQTTIDSNMNILQLHFIPVLGKMKITKITALHLQTIINKMLDDGLSPCTVRRDFSVVSAILQKAYKWGLVQENVARRCELPKYQKAEMQFWNAEQARTFLKALTLPYSFACKGHDRTLGSTGAAYRVRRYDRKYTISRAWREFFNLELHTGMRRGELCGLRWSDVDFENCTVSVNQVIGKVKNGYIIKEPKTKSSRRTIAISKDVINSLKGWKKEQMETSIAVGDLWAGYRGADYDQNFVFTSADYPGRPFYPDSVGAKFHKIIRDYNEQYNGDLPDINFHGTRHTSATLLISEGIDVVEISHRLGHSKTSTTEDVYAHQLKHVDEHVADVLDDILQKKI